MKEVNCSMQRKGKWIKGVYDVDTNTYRFKDGSKGLSSNIYGCTECDNEAYWDTDYGQQLFRFCPYCGAKMENGR